jgi:RNase adapter protein RapZ
VQVVIVTGLSGAGKSTALRALEDVEFTCVDNMPMPFVGTVIEHVAHEGEVGKVAVAIDARQHRHLASWRDLLGRLRDTGHRLDVMFLDATDDVLLRRYSETRRRHPLSGDDLADGILRDRALMAELRTGANVVDTSNLSPHQLKSIIQDYYGGDGRLAVTLLSFGFKHGLPAEFNHVFDVRFLPNPHFVPELKPFDGRDREVAGYVFTSPDSREMVEHIERLLRFSLPQFHSEGKLYVTIAVGCTGGRHRSVAVVEELRRRLGDDWDILVRHRDVDRGE